MIQHDGLELSWLGYATLRVANADTVVYLDPGRYGVLDDIETPLGDGDIVCVTHNHHYDTDGIRRVADADATLVLFEGINTHRISRDIERPADLPYEIREVDMESDIAIDDVILRTTAAYNEPDGPHVRPNGEPYHPKGLGCGFHVTLEGTSVYWPGDTDVLDGHEHLDVDVFCPPIGGSFTMNRHEAADLAEALDPELVIPIHYDTFDAIEADAEAFASDLEARGISVHLDE
ncbi:MAG: L-ascorbate metabolism protein UlaG (beta-lactamase superfamily) [Natronomonas sp.]|jgi:L-ascorbate metabolism protein UlaG (beta-lactamase superfamily)|uniref:MBL fold metallo-hydrolase n=1 Tax=Natronomonas sp. TaxID=2184060 RepID=UPI003988FA69